MWDLPGPGLEPVSPALAGGFLTTAPPGKSQHLLFIFEFSAHLINCRILFYLTLKNLYLSDLTVINYQRIEKSEIDTFV